MPKRKRSSGSYFRSKRRRFVYRKKRRFRRKPNILNAGRPLGPSGKLIRFKYVDTISLDPGIATAIGYIFCANGLFDPNITGGGHQPYGYDQWLPTFANHYCVVSSRCRVRFVSRGTTNAQDNTYVVGIDLRDSNASITGQNTDRLMETTPNHKVLTTSEARGYVQVSKGFSARKFFKVKDAAGMQYLQSIYSSNPTEQAYFHVFAGAADGVSDPNPVTAIVQIDYLARLIEPNELPQS